MIYEILLMVGVLGLGAMLMLGFAHTGHGHGADAGHAHGGHVGHGHGGHEAFGHASHGHGAHAGAHGAGHGADAATHSGHGSGTAHGTHHGDHAGEAVAHHHDGAAAQAAHLDWMAVLSPLGLFSMSLGAGATGVALRSAGLQGGVVALAAVAGALLFRFGVVRPLWNLVFSFASRPAGTLDGTLLQEAEAITAFNERGEGLVRLVVDGQSMDVLARLEAPAEGVRVLRGQRVRVESVDAHRNSVTVSRL